MKEKIIIFPLLIVLALCLPTQFAAAELQTENSVIFGVRNYADSYYVNGENVSRDAYYTKLAEELERCGDFSNITYDDETQNAQSKYDAYVLSGYVPINNKEDVKDVIKDFCNTITGPSQMYIVTTSGISTEEVFEITSIWPALGNQCTLYGYVHHYSSYVSSSKAYNSVKSLIIERSRLEYAEGYEEAVAIAKDIVAPVRSQDRYSQIKYVYEYLCNNISKTSGRTSSFKNAFIDKVSDSNGYALAFQACMEELGIPSYYLTECAGSWNVVQMDGKWYWVDAASGDNTPSIDYKYLLCGTNVKTATTDLVVSSSSYNTGEQTPVPLPVPEVVPPNVQPEETPGETTTETEDQGVCDTPTEITTEIESEIPTETEEPIDAEEKDSETENDLNAEQNTDVESDLQKSQEETQQDAPENNLNPMVVIAIAGGVGVAGVGGGAGYLIWRKFIK